MTVPIRGGKPKGLEKAGGRGPGIPNKFTRDMRSGIREFLENNWDTIQVEFDNLQHPVDKLTFLLKLMEFSIPKLKSVELTAIQAQKVDALTDAQVDMLIEQRSEERRVGKECVSRCRCRWWRKH